MPEVLKNGDGSTNWVAIFSALAASFVLAVPLKLNSAIIVSKKDTMMLKPLKQEDFKMRIVRELEPILVQGKNRLRKYRVAVFECSTCKKEIKRVVRQATYTQVDCKSCSVIKKKTTHGDCGTRLYNVWAGMVQRCEDKNTEAYKNYGGRGISISKDIRKYEDFKVWALSNGYSDNLTLERIDVNLGYSRDNCTFIPIEEQARNKRNTYRVEYNGKTVSMFELSKMTGVPAKRLYDRIHNKKWGIEKAIKTPKMKNQYKAAEDV